LTPVVLAALFLAAGCGGGGSGGSSGPSYPKKETVRSANTQVADGVWTFLPAGKPKRLVIFFHGQGGPTEATPQNHRPWIDHLVKRGAIVVYPRYEMDYSAAVIDPAISGIQTAKKRFSAVGLPVMALGYSRGAAMAVEYAALAARRNVPVPDAIETVNPVPYGETARIVSLKPIRRGTMLAVLISDKDPHAIDGSTMLLHRLRDAGFPANEIELNVAHSRKGFVADHLAPLSASPAAQAAYWGPTDALLTSLQ
jgi:hypothetical protein